MIVACVVSIALFATTIDANFFDFLYRPEVQYVPKPEQPALVEMNLGFRPLVGSIV